MKVTSVRILALSLVLLLLLPPVLAQNQKYEFPAVRFDDTLYAAIDAAFRVTFDDAGDLWYTTQAGLVHVDLDARERTLLTRQDGLPSSYAIGLDHRDGLVYAATELGVAVVDVASKQVVRTFTDENSPLPETIVQEVRVVGEEVWFGTFASGVAVWNQSTDAWAFKNTSTNVLLPHPVRRIVPDAEGVWVATEGNGVWRYDRAQGSVGNGSAWRVLLREDGLPSLDVLSVATYGRDVFFGTDQGVSRHAPYEQGDDRWAHFGAADGMRHPRTLDLDVVRHADSLYLYAATRENVWRLDLLSGRSDIVDQVDGLLGTRIFDVTPHPTFGWAFASDRGVSLLREDGWSYYVTGPSEGRSSGPLSFVFTSASVGNAGEWMWFGTAGGLSAYNPYEHDGRGAWVNLGDWQYYPGSIVNHIDTEDGVTWIATNNGTWGFVHETTSWIPRLARAPSANIVYGLDAVDGELWVALFGDGLLMQNLETGEERAWSEETTPALPDRYVTDVRVQGDDVWVGSSVGLTRISRSSGAILGAWTYGDGLPDAGFVYRVLPDGPVVWVGQREGGVARFDVSQGRVTGVWNHTLDPEFPDAEVRALHREGSRLWVGTTEGLVRIDVASGDVKRYDTSNSLLVQNYVNGITTRDGVLYAATLSGLARLDLETGAFLPLHVRAGDEAAGGPRAGGAPAAIRVRIDRPSDGAAVTGTVNVTGTAFRFDGVIDRVEVRVGEGPWRAADGTARWSYAWDTTGLPPHAPVVVAARAFAGNETSAPVEILVTPVALPRTPLTLQHEPPASARAGVSLGVSARATGDDPLTVTLYYRKPGERGFTPLPLVRDGALFAGAIPAKHVREGLLTYYLEARSGLLATTSPADPARPHGVPVGPAPRVAAGVEGPAKVVAPAGVATPFLLEITNTGTQPATFDIAASGLRSAWLTLERTRVTLPPGASQNLTATVAAPDRAFSDNTTLAIQVRDTDGAAEAVTVRIPLEVVAAPGATDVQDAPRERGFLGIPGPSAALAAILLGGTALALRRRWRG